MYGTWNRRLSLQIEAPPLRAITLLSLCFRRNQQSGDSPSFAVLQLER